MAFGAEELRVLRRALALALHPSPASAEDVQDCLRLAESLDEAMREGARLRAFLVADLARYRAALPGTAAGYLTLLEEALTAGYHPTPDDLAALRALRGKPTAATLLTRCRPLTAHPARQATPAAPAIPASRTHLQALPGGLADASPATTVVLPAQDTGQEPDKPPRRKPAEKPAAPKPGPGPEPTPAAPRPPRPIPTPGEVFPRRKPTPPPTNPPQQLAAG
ncbi:hypothetical protein EJ357_26190 [Streptomyces cyaneochromogenes]|uniref:Uncharacterized protein n=1 Tax=Streptomyces cyaneochromogenes TaxID=2496836 RepID=A0A3Q9F208_9ACTN|nr:hypothetical protein [Streptomyces cyaneochromogenes]AZQ40607.1 hypothetical protein EJ357_26190 [Streptomyces cyaneochromogenes]